MRGCVAAKRRYLIQIIDSLLGSTEMIFPRSLEPMVRGVRDYSSLAIPRPTNEKLSRSDSIPSSYGSKLR